MENFYTKDEYTRDEYINALRKGAGARANLYYSTMQVLKERGLNYKEIMAEIIVKFGDNIVKKENLYDEMHTPKDYAKMFTSGDSAEADAFGQELIEADEDRCVIRMHNCPLTAEWKKLNIPLDDMKEICDIANIVDFETAKKFGGIKLDIKCKMGHGDKYCELIAAKK